MTSHPTLLPDTSISPSLTSPELRLVDYFRFEFEAARINHAELVVFDTCLKPKADPDAAIGSVAKSLSVLGENFLNSCTAGWITENRLGILLEYPVRSEVASVVSLLRQEPCIKHVSVWGDRKIEQDNRPLNRLYARRTPVSKRIADIALSSVLLVLTFPILLVSGLLVKLTSTGPALFGQTRVGLGGKPFEMYKLRTMRKDADDTKDELRSLNEMDGMAFKITNDPRITPVGMWLRRISIDELPQLVNVLRGEMSLVGPRPLPLNDWKPDDPEYNLRHDVLPGITCIWQTESRNDTTWYEWFEMDLDYIQNRSMMLDLKLMARTVLSVLRREGK